MGSHARRAAEVADEGAKRRFAGRHSQAALGNDKG